MYGLRGELAGSSAYAFHRAVCYNEAVFEAPRTYDPERFLKDGKLDGSANGLEERVFGSGRRYARALASGHRAIAALLTLLHDSCEQGLSRKALRASNFVP